jgi:thiol-disulfide isomerase/thioredoxin
MKFSSLPGILTAIMAVCVGNVTAADLGDPAAPLQIAGWVKGKPVDVTAGTNSIYVVEFWATWCPPCRTSIPHLTEMQKKFKDKGVVFVGISAEEAGTVTKFVKKMGNQMDYTVAVDKDRETSDAYMKRYGQNGIPHAFIVDKEHRVIWHGHPMSGLDTTLDQIIAGKYDINLAKKRLAAAAKLEEFYELASQGADEEKLAAMGAELETLDKELGGIEPGETFKASDVLNMIKFQNAVMAYQRAFAAGKSEAELDGLGEKIKAVAPEKFDYASFKEDLALRKLLTAYYRAVSGSGDTNTIQGLGRQIEQTKSKNAQLLNDFAWAILADESIQIRDLDLATKLAKTAVDASDGKSPGPLDTYARALFDSGKVAEAVEWETKAVAAADDDEKRKELETTLEAYQRKTVK